MLLIPWLTGCGVARRLDGKEMLLLLATLMLFLTQTQLMNMVRLRFATAPDFRAVTRIRILMILFGCVATLAVLLLIVLYHRLALVLFGVPAVILTGISILLVHRKLDRSLWGQILASAGLSLGAPLAYYVARGILGRLALELWVVNSLFFLGGVFYVQLKIDALPKRAQLITLATRFRFASRMLALDVTILALVFVMLRAGSMSPRSVLAFAPTLIQAIIGTIRLNRPAKLKRVGIISTVHSILFAGILIWLA